MKHREFWYMLDALAMGMLGASFTVSDAHENYVLFTGVAMMLGFCGGYALRGSVDD